MSHPPSHDSRDDGTDLPSAADTDGGGWFGGDTDDGTREEVFPQFAKPEVDILWVVDNSYSMAEEQHKLTQAFPEFIKFFLGSGLDWHIGVVSTDTSDDRQNGKLSAAGGYRFITPDVSNLVAVFSAMASPGINGSGSPKGTLAAFRALTAPTAGIQDANRGFYRESASLHIVVISDEEDLSAPTLTRNEFVTFLQDLKPDEETAVTFSSVVGPLPVGCSSADTDAVAGSVYIAITNAIGGVSRSICEEDWGPMLGELGLLALGLRTEFFLSYAPEPGSVKVWVVDGDLRYEGVDATELRPDVSLQDACVLHGATTCFTFTVNSGKLSLVDFVPSPLSEVHVRYRPLSR